MRYILGQKPRQHRVSKILFWAVAIFITLLLLDCVFNYSKLTIDFIYEII